MSLGYLFRFVEGGQKGTPRPFRDPDPCGIRMGQELSHSHNRFSGRRAVGTVQTIFRFGFLPFWLFTLFWVAALVLGSEYGYITDGTSASLESFRVSSHLALCHGNFRLDCDRTNQGPPHKVGK